MDEQLNLIMWRLRICGGKKIRKKGGKIWMDIFIFCTTGHSSCLNVISGESMVQSPRSGAALQRRFSSLHTPKLMYFFET